MASFSINKKIVVDNNNKPVEVIIDYDKWIEIENFLKLQKKIMTKEKLQKYIGIIKLKEDPLEFQDKIRDEWK